MVIGCEAELYLHKLQAKTKRVSELTRSVSERCQSRLTWSRACVPDLHSPLRPHLHGLRQGCVGRPRGVPSCWCCVAVGTSSWRGAAGVVGGRDEQQANQPAPIWGDGWVLFFFCPIITVSFFLFFWARIAGTKLRQEDIIQGTKTRTRADQGHTQGVAPSSIPLGKRSGCLGQIGHSPAQMKLKQQGARP
jgi:hypothetical protein